MIDAPPDGPWAETLDRLAQLDPYWAGEIGAPSGAGWFRLDEVAAADTIPGWLDDIAAEHDGQRDVAASYLGGWLAGVAVVIPVAAYVVERRLPDPADVRLWGRQHADGWFDRVAFESSRVLVAPDDPAAEHADSVVSDEAEALDRYGAALVDVLSPALERIRSIVAYGRSGLWGAVIDEIASSALWASRVAGTDPDDAWRVASALSDAVAARTRWVRARPRPFAVQGPDGRALFQVRSTCCLYYKTQPEPLDPTGDGYCNTCPLRDDRSRYDRLVAHLTLADTEA